MSITCLGNSVPRKGRTRKEKFNRFRLVSATIGRFSDYRDTGISPIPVSYTHLDVYKRQRINYRTPGTTALILRTYFHPANSQQLYVTCFAYKLSYTWHNCIDSAYILSLIHIQMCIRDSCYTRPKTVCLD